MTDLLAVERAIATFREQYPGYATPSGARDRCDSAAGKFLECLADEGVTALKVSSVFVDEDDIVLWGHYAVRVDDFVYDWTARQFYPPADWPVIVPYEQWTEHLRVLSEAW